MLFVAVTMQLSQVTGARNPGRGEILRTMRMPQSARTMPDETETKCQSNLRVELHYSQEKHPQSYFCCHQRNSSAPWTATNYPPILARTMNITAFHISLFVGLPVRYRQSPCNSKIRDRVSRGNFSHRNPCKCCFDRAPCIQSSI